MDTYSYYIENGLWKFTSSSFVGDLLGVLISIDKKDYYKKLNKELCVRNFSSQLPDSIITLQKHGIPTNVKKYYLTYVDSPLREFCSFYYLELFPTNINCENINKIISTSCLPLKYLDNLIKDNQCLTVDAEKE